MPLRVPGGLFPHPSRQGLHFASVVSSEPGAPLMLKPCLVCGLPSKAGPLPSTHRATTHPCQEHNRTWLWHTTSTGTPTVGSDIPRGRAAIAAKPSTPLRLGKPLTWSTVVPSTAGWSATQPVTRRRSSGERSRPIEACVMASGVVRLTTTYLTDAATVDCAGVNGSGPWRRRSVRAVRLHDARDPTLRRTRRGRLSSADRGCSAVFRRRRGRNSLGTALRHDRGHERARRRGAGWRESANWCGVRVVQAASSLSSRE